MDKRTGLALLLTAVVMFGLPLMYPKAWRQQRPKAVDTGALTGGTAKSPAPATSAGGSPNPGAAAPSAVASAPTGTSTSTGTGADTGRAVTHDTIAVAGDKATYSFVVPGAVPNAVTLPDYRDLSSRRTPAVRLAQRGAPLLRYRVVSATDTIDLTRVAATSQPVGRGTRFDVTPAAGDDRRIAIEYTTGERPFVMHVRGSVSGPASEVLIDLPETLESFEADTLDDQRHHAYGYKRSKGDVTSIAFTKLDSTKIRTDSGPLRWVAARDKYFLVALVTPDSSTSFKALRMRGGHRVSRGTATAFATAVLPIRNGQFAFDLYTGPQTWTELKRFGVELENVNPYAGILHSVAQPFVTIVMRILLWLKATLRINYGWVLVAFGVVLRILMWPLNQTAMRASIKMQRVQPELQAVQKRYANDPEAQRKAIMKVYQDHGMNPLSPLMGCLPMMLPMPILFALYFVFQNTIEFRGVPFLWLPDLSLRDPYYITPIFMGISMFALSWIGMRNMPPNPQAKVMSYTMPAVLTFMFLNFASGLNLYYGVQNLVALPQQWLLTRERARSAAAAATTPRGPRGKSG